MRDDEAFRVLGLPPSATREEIRAAYRRLVKAWHPDRHGSNPERRAIAEETVKRVIEAYRSVRNGVIPPEPERRPPPTPTPHSAMFSVDPTAAPAFRASRQTYPPSAAEERLRKWRIAREWLPRIAVIAGLLATSGWWLPVVSVIGVRVGIVDPYALRGLPERLDGRVTLADRAACYSLHRASYVNCVISRVRDKAYGVVNPHPYREPGSLEFTLCAKLQWRYSKTAYDKCVAELQQVRRN